MKSQLGNDDLKTSSEDNLAKNIQKSKVFRKGYLSVPTNGVFKSSKAAYFILKGKI